MVMIAALLAVAHGAGPIGGRKSGYKSRRLCSPQPWVVGHTRGATSLKGSRRSDTVSYYNAKLQNGYVVGLYDGGRYSVEEVSEIDITKTYGYCCSD